MGISEFDSSLLREVAEIGDTIRALALQHEAECQLTPALIEKLRSIGCFRMLVPRAYGGLEFSLLSALRVLEEIARLDASTAWVVMIGCETPILLSLFPRQTFDELYQHGPDVILASSSVPSGSALVGGASITVEGTWPYASGCTHAQWFMGHTRQRHSDEETSCEDQSLLAFLVPMEEVTVISDWNVLGLGASGSHSVRVPSCEVKTPRTFRPSHATSCLNLPVYRIPVRLHFGLHMAAIALGIAQASLDHLGSWYRDPTHRVKGKRTKEDAIRTFEFGKHASSLLAARLALHAIAEQITSHVRATNPNPDHSPEENFPRSLLLQAQAISVSVAQQCRALVDTMFMFGCTTAIFTTQPLQRYLRDIQVVCQHANLSLATFTELGESLARGGHEL